MTRKPTLRVLGDVTNRLGEGFMAVVVRGHALAKKENKVLGVKKWRTGPGRRGIFAGVSSYMNVVMRSNCPGNVWFTQSEVTDEIRRQR